MWTSPVVQLIRRLFFISQGYPRIMLFHFLRFNMKKFCIMFLLLILRWSLTWCWIIPLELLVPLAFWAYIGPYMEFLQRPLHSPSHVEVDAADSCPTVNQSSGLSDFYIFCLVKSYRNSDSLSRCCYKYGPNVCEK